MSSPPPKVFNLDEANALLPSLESLFLELEKKQEAFQKLQDELLFEELLGDSTASDAQHQGLENVLLGLQEEIEKIRTFGCLLRHPEKGMVDFLGRKDGGWIYYCWRRGEKRIQFYHTLRGGFYERHPLH